jgi:hypothetical protein
VTSLRVSNFANLRFRREVYQHVMSRVRYPTLVISKPSTIANPIVTAASPRLESARNLAIEFPAFVRKALLSALAPLFISGELLDQVDLASTSDIAKYSKIRSAT